jgi:hypothetical protein
MFESTNIHDHDARNYVLGNTERIRLHRNDAAPAPFRRKVSDTAPVPVDSALVAPVPILPKPRFQGANSARSGPDWMRSQNK